MWRYINIKPSSWFVEDTEQMFTCFSSPFLCSGLLIISSIAEMKTGCSVSSGMPILWIKTKQNKILITELIETSKRK